MLLSQLTSPEDLRSLSDDQLPALAEEIRSVLIETTSRHGGHLASNLGMVELTIALHRIFDARKDVILFDTGHQSYVHKLLTGRYQSFQNLRQEDGCSGFPCRSESPYDHFGTGHSGTAVSAALGFAAARDRTGSGGKVIAVLGDGALGCGSSLEAINNISVTTRDFILILNDNKMSIAPNVGALSRCLSRVISGQSYNRFKTLCAATVERLPLIGSRLRGLISRFELATKQFLLPAAFFEQLGLRYIGPIDGHDLSHLLSTLKRVRNLHSPRLIHVLTVKGKGFSPAEAKPDCFHGTAPFNCDTGSLVKPPAEPSFSTTLGNHLKEIHRDNSSIVAITAGMRDGTGLRIFAQAFPHAFYDVGIAEAHGCAFAAGLAAAGQRPVFAVYASFMQRGFDYVFHDACLQKLPVVFCLDRAGVVADGPTHHGIYDFAFWRAMPNLAVLQPADYLELQQMLSMSVRRTHPVVIRYPGGAASAVCEPTAQLEWGKAATMLSGTSPLAIWAVGREVKTALEAAHILHSEDIFVTVVNVRFTLPFDQALMREQLAAGLTIVTLEDHCQEGGFGTLARDCLADLPNARIHKLGWPKAILPHGSISYLRQRFAMTAEQIAATIKNLLTPTPVASSSPSQAP